MTWSTGQTLITIWVLVVIAMIIFLLAGTGCTKRIERPECDKACQDEKLRIKEAFKRKKFN